MKNKKMIIRILTDKIHDLEHLTNNQASTIKDWQEMHKEWAAKEKELTSINKELDNKLSRLELYKNSIIVEKMDAIEKLHKDLEEANEKIRTFQDVNRVREELEEMAKPKYQYFKDIVDYATKESVDIGAIGKNNQVIICTHLHNPNYYDDELMSLLEDSSYSYTSNIPQEIKGNWVVAYTTKAELKKIQKIAKRNNSLMLLAI